MLAARITLPHFSVSSTTIFSNSAGDIGIGTTAELGKTRLDLFVGEGRVYFLVERGDDVVGRVFEARRCLATCLPRSLR